ncbi:hypothetical protein [Cesiribacter sp. SM1]|uniref:hypothetical protein n=1 Tax=Cesiribacter sp. SM1 TaxID=2861196 RepID=UPI001CD1EC7B|nr:hypothetical protein [Cesiribacter sp. SM1]
MAQRKSFRGAIDKTNITDKGGIKSLVGSNPTGQPSPKLAEEEPASAAEEAKDIRQTFVIREDYLERLKDYVHMMRITEDSYYTQKDAMQDALDKLFEAAGEIPERPDKLKEREKDRASRIRKARRS